MRWLRRIGLALLVLAVALVAWEPTRVALQTAVMLPNMLGSGPQPLTLFSPEPQRTSVAYRLGPDGTGEPDLAELWLPAWASADRPAGAILLVFGVNNLGRNHPAIVRVADALARTGVAVLVPDSRTLLEGRLEVGEIDGVVDAFRDARRPPGGRPRAPGHRRLQRRGLAGTARRPGPGDRGPGSVGERVRGIRRCRDVPGLGGRPRLRRTRRRARAWLPTPLAREVELRFLLEQVDDADDRATLDAAFGDAVLAGDRPSPDAALRASLGTEEARTVHDLLTSASLTDAARAIGALPDESLAFVDAISPIRHLAGLSASVFLMHETEDHHVPYVESRALAEALEPSGRLARHTEFRLFDHVQPDDLDLLAAAPELWKLLLHVRQLMEETL